MLEAGQAFFERRGARRAVGLGQLEADRGGLLLEQPAPRARTGDRLLGEDALFGLGEEMLAEAPDRSQVMAGEGQPVVGEHRIDVVLRGGRPLELEEDELGRDGGRSFFDALHGRRDLVVEHVDAEAQPGVRAGAPDELVQAWPCRA